VVNRALHLAIRSVDHLVLIGQTEAAATILENYLQVHPPVPEVLSRLGRIRLEEGRSEEAARLLEQALKYSAGARGASATGQATTAPAIDSGLSILGTARE
jgi:Flp pilus assembly protein TadD